MTAHHYAVAEWEPGRVRLVPLALMAEARECAHTLAVVVAVSRRHALRLYLEGVEAIRGADGRLERFGVLRQGGAL